MDHIDYKILKALQKNARETASNIGKEIHLSVSAVIERIRKLEEAHVIDKYTIIVDEKKAGNDMNAIMEIALEKPTYYDAFAKGIQDMENVVSCYYVTGGFDLILKLSCKSPEELDSIHRQIMELDGIKETRTHVVVKTTKNVYSAIRKPDKPEKVGKAEKAAK
ncbi:MAG: Lrp/AsnC family transcriptional regulator [Eubacteriales bacterium]|nr:Lrp/AsnC family transcriptional regulator [Eubacteriales bacterium]